MINNLIIVSSDKSFYYTPSKSKLINLDKIDRNFNLFKDNSLYTKGEVFTYLKVNSEYENLSSYNKANKYKEETNEPLEYNFRILK